MALTGRFCSLNQFFRGHFACGDKNMSPKSLFLSFTSYGGNLLAVMHSVWMVELFHQGFFNTPFYIFIGLQNNMIYISKNVNRGHIVFWYFLKNLCLYLKFFLFSFTCFIILLYRHNQDF